MRTNTCESLVGDKRGRVCNVTLKMLCRPITMYNAYTGTMTAILMNYMHRRKILPMERGCLDAIVIDEAVAREKKVGRGREMRA